MFDDRRLGRIATVILIFGFLANLALAQRGGAGNRGGGRAGGGGRPAGGMTRPAGGGMQRPSGGASRPAGGMTRPSTGVARPSNPGAQRPGAGGGNVQRPGAGGGNVQRPGAGGGNVQRPGAGGGNVQRPGGNGNRPGGGLVGNLRPGSGAGGPSTRPAPGPGSGVTRPIPGNRPGVGGGGNTAVPLPGNRPGLGGDRPGVGGGNRPGNGGDRPGIGGGNRPGGGGSIGLPGDWTRPNPPGDGNRPGVGNRPGEGNRPGIGNRPGDGNRPGWANRPGWNNGQPNRPGGNGNWWQMGDNVGVVNRPNNSNNWFGGNTNNNININNITNNNISNNYYRGGNNWWGGGRGGGYAGWRNPYYGYHSGWYYGGWDRNYFGNAFWGGFAGAMTANAASNLFNLFPTWGSYGYSSWGLTPVVSNTYYSNYVNPYYATPVAAAAQPSVTVYNYSQPLATAAATDAGANAAPAQIDASEAQFQSARDAFKAGNYDDALKLADQALTSVPGDTALHEFRALCLFALGRYTESSAVLYAVLTAGPGWSWSTMIGLYPDVETYTNQLRSLEGYVKQNPNSASGHFVLAYQYMTAGHKEAAASEFQRVATLEPKDQLSSKFVQVLAPAAADNQVAAEPPAPAENATAVADASQTDAKQPTPPPAALVGSWTAKPDDSLTITLAIANEGDFTWTVTPKQGKPQVIKGKALYLEGEMALTQEQGNPLVGKVETPDAGTMKFSLLGDDKAPALVFKKGA